VALLQPCHAAEIGQPLPFLFSHMVAVGQVGARDSRVPAVTTDRMARHVRDRVPDVVMVVDGVQGFILHLAPAPPRDPGLQQRGIEDRLLRCRVQFEERGQPAPYGGQRADVRPVDLFQDREQPPLLVMIVKDQLGDIH
jgi:hypothetical protein